MKSEIRNIVTKEIQSVGIDWSTLLIKGDCLEVMSELADMGIKVDMVLTDPPYGTTACKWDSIIPFQPMWECLRGLRNDNTPIVLFGSEPFSSMLRCSNIKEFKYDWVWHKSKASNFLLAKKQPLKKHEVISVFYPHAYHPIKTQGVPYNKGKRKNVDGVATEVYNKIPNCGKYEIKSDGDRYPTSIQYFVTAEQEGKHHPTQKPVALLEYLIKTYTNDGDLVLDFTAGSFSTAIACLNTNRRFIGIELDEKYYKIGIERVKKELAEQKGKLF